jgi:hypothetical protein
VLYILYAIGMSITFASGDTLKQKVSSEHDFDFFSGKHPSTLKESDLLLMELERKKRQRCVLDERRRTRTSPEGSPSPLLYHPYPSGGHDAAISSEDRREFAARLRRAPHPPPASWSGITLSVDRSSVPALSPSQSLTYEDLSPEEKTGLVRATHKKLLETFAQVRRCINCSAHFNELANVGQRKCVWHPGAQRLGVWTCCDEKTDFITEVTKRPVGCCECDHTAEDFDPLRGNMTEMPLSVAVILDVPSACIVAIQTPSNLRLSDLHKRCYVIRATQKRVPHRKAYRPPQDFRNLPVSDIQLLRERLELAPKHRVMHFEDPITFDNYAGHAAPGYHLNY